MVDSIYLCIWGNKSVKKIVRYLNNLLYFGSGVENDENGEYICAFYRCNDAGVYTERNNRSN